MIINHNDVKKNRILLDAARSTPTGYEKPDLITKLDNGDKFLNPKHIPFLLGKIKNYLEVPKIS